MNKKKFTRVLIVIVCFLAVVGILFSLSSLKDGNGVVGGDADTTIDTNEILSPEVTKDPEESEEPVAPEETKCIHHYTSVITSEPTCKDVGLIVWTCDFCDDSYDEAIPKLNNHVYDIGVVTKEPTCLNIGEKTFTCFVCSITYTENIPLSSNHKFDIIGNCSICGKSCSHVFGAYTVIDSAKHERQCSLCKLIQINKHSFTNGVCYCDYTCSHSFDEGIVTQEPTCAVEGLKTFTCSICNIKKINPIPKTDSHNFLLNDEGISDGECDTCGYECIHKYGTYTGEPSLVACVKATPQLCNKCNYAVSWNREADHSLYSYSSWQGIEDCKEKSYKICSGCMTIYDTDIGADSHSWDDGVFVSLPDCFSSGQKKYTCEVCSFVRIENIPALNHNYVLSTEVGDYTYLENDQHKANFYEQCSFCFDKKMYDFMIEDCNYSDGVCVDCSHYCEHTDTDSYYYNKEITFINSEYHEVLSEIFCGVCHSNVTGDRYTESHNKETIDDGGDNGTGNGACWWECEYCTSCDYEEYIYHYDHEYINGKCTKCGKYEAGSDGCSHKNARWEPDDYKSPTPVGGGTHYAYYNYVCYDCDSILDSKSEYQTCNFYNGSCSLCGNTLSSGGSTGGDPSCAHSNVIEAEGYELCWTNYLCTDCGAITGKEHTGFSDDGTGRNTCSYCGQQ